jgi:hypothetical protein
LVGWTFHFFELASPQFTYFSHGVFFSDRHLHTFLRYLLFKLKTCEQVITNQLGGFRVGSLKITATWIPLFQQRIAWPLSFPSILHTSILTIWVFEIRMHYIHDWGPNAGTRINRTTTEIDFLFLFTSLSSTWCRVQALHFHLA